MADLPPDDPDLLDAHRDGQAAIDAGDVLDAELAEAMRDAGRLPGGPDRTE